MNWRLILFMITFLPLCPVMIFFGLCYSIGQIGDELLHKYERWAFRDPTLI